MRNTKNADYHNQQIWPHQLITMNDLALFKVQLLQEIKNMFLNHGPSQETTSWMKSSEVQKLLKISRGKLFSLRVCGTLPYTRIGGMIYYKRADIETMLEANKRII